MQLSEQVITLEQAKKLKEIGFERDSLGKIEDEYKTIHQIGRDYLWDLYRANNDTLDWGEGYNAYTVSELMEYLPDTILARPEDEDDEEYKTLFSIVINKNKYTKKEGCEYAVFYISEDDYFLGDIDFRKDNLAQALGDMLIYLIENKYIEL